MTLGRHLVFALWLAASVAAAQDAPIGEVRVHPTTIEIRHPRHPQSIQVLGVDADGFTVDLRATAKIASADPKTARVDEKGWVHPVADGVTQITVAAAGKSMTIPVRVELPKSEPAISFRHEVMPVLSKGGCNMGACHGYSLGKNGFKLSLRGQDASQDYPSLVRETMGRRVNRLVPEASLIVAKPCGDVPHEGGLRFRRGSLSERILVRWIEGGAPDDLADPAQIVGVQLVPDKLVLRPGQPHQVQMLAKYEGGIVRDVTRLTVFSANNTQFADVDDEGLVTANDAGETAIVARFERVFASTNVIVLNPNRKFAPAPAPEHLVDRAVVDKLNRLKISPSPLAGDEEFLRRVYLDLIGLQPNPTEIRAFLADKNPKKRDEAIDRLFERPEFVDHWSLKWGDLLQNSRTTNSAASVFLFREFLRGAVASNMPMDELARRLLTARGSAVDDPASGFLASSKDANDSLERVTQVFCGVRMLCARCHSHPAENWTQADYYGLASSFNQASSRPDVRSPANQPQKLLAIDLKVGSAVNPRTGKPQPPRFLGGQDLPLDATADRRVAYARWLTSPTNPYFARGTVNRIWSCFFHRGIIEPVDDIRSTNPPINPALLDALAEDFARSKFDLRALMKRIVTSATYQRTSIATDSNRHDEQNFSHAIPRRIPAEALLDSLVQATAVPEAFGNAPAGFRAAQLPDATVQSQFLNLFGKPLRMEACECERDNSSNMLQALHFMNSASILGRTQNPAGRPALLLKQKKTDEEIVTELYLWSLARNPTEKERKVGLDFLALYAPPRRQEAVQDLMWALLNSKDFVMVH
jgi:Protein of unknown function (DUF1553)/Protein of unknown function (DUF1549)